MVENLKVVASQQQKEREFNSKIASAMMYPIFVFSLTLIVGLGVAWFILPRLATVFAQMRIELPLLTRWLIALGTLLGQYGLIVIPAVLVVLSLIVYFVFFFPKTQFIGQSLLFLFPPLAQLLMGLELSRFGYLLGNLLEAGLPILDSLDSLAGSTTLNRYKKFYLFLHDRMAEGNSFGKSFEMYKGSYDLIPSSIQQLIIVGEQSGNLATTLQKIGSLYEDKTDVTTKNISVLLEPILLVIVWLGVVGVAVAVILPLYGLIGNLNNVTSAPPAPVETISVSPSPLPTVNRLKITDTGIGYLNIRKSPIKTSEIVGRAIPGEIFTYSQSQDNWYKIDSGWVSGSYVEILK